VGEINEAGKGHTKSGMKRKEVVPDVHRLRPGTTIKTTDARLKLEEKVNRRLQELRICRTEIGEGNRRVPRQRDQHMRSRV